MANKSTTVTAGAEQVITLDIPYATVELVHHGDASEPVWYRADGTAAVAAADENKVLLATERLTIPAAGDGTVSISIVSAGAPTVTLEGVA